MDPCLNLNFEEGQDFQKGRSLLEFVEVRLDDNYRENSRRLYYMNRISKIAVGRKFSRVICIISFLNELR